jgi:MbtH protein
LTVDREDPEVHVVLVNDEKEYSLWPAGESVPTGWREAGLRGSKADCLGWIESVWTDMRPQRLRDHAHDAKC